jgi:hypothetical protein
MKKLLPALLLAVISTSAFAQCDPVFGKLVINEFMARNAVVSDQDGENDDWIEIHNATDEPINMLGYFLSDSRGNRTKFQFPDTVVAAGGHIVVWADNQPWQDGLHAEFALGGTVGDQLVLCTPSPDTLIIDYINFYEMDNLSSYGRFPNGHGPFRYMAPSPSAENTTTDYRGLVINEFLARNTMSGSDEFGDFDDWIELYNNRTVPLNLGGYFLSDGLGNKTKYTFPEPTILGAGGYIIVWADGEPHEGSNHANFSLSGAGEQVLLSNADTLTLDYVRFGPQLQDVSEGRYENGIGRIRCLEPTILATNSPSSVSVQEIAFVEFWAYPNPATDFINLKVFDNAVTTARMFDLMGRQIDQFYLDGGRNYQIDLSGYTPGVYLLQVGASAKRIVKQ